jgi:hypothetical protein
MRNPFGDSIANFIDYQEPEWILEQVMTRGSDIINPCFFWDQRYTQIFQINDKTKWQEQYDSIDSGFASTYKDGNGQSIDAPYTYTEQLTSNGGYHLTETYSDGSTLSRYMYLIDDFGSVHHLSTVFNDSISISAFQEKLFAYNWELVFSSSEFAGRTIDLVVIPQIFNELY